MPIPAPLRCNKPTSRAGSSTAGAQYIDAAARRVICARLHAGSSNSLLQQACEPGRLVYGRRAIRRRGGSPRYLRQTPCRFQRRFAATNQRAGPARLRQARNVDAAARRVICTRRRSRRSDVLGIIVQTSGNPAWRARRPARMSQCTKCAVLMQVACATTRRAARRTASSAPCALFSDCATSPVVPAAQNARNMLYFPAVL